MSTPVAVGIDLGTTYSVAARIDPQGRSEIVRNLHGDLLTPSVVLFDQQEIVVGKVAKKAAAAASDRVAECAKRDIGSRFYSRPIKGQQMPPEAILACILRQLKKDITNVVGSDFKVVVTVPAYFDEPRRQATADAARIADIDMLDIVNEPTAAALAFGEQLGYLTATGEPSEAMRVLVYDLGGGTFDVTVIELASGNIRTLATDGDVQLGGRDWDQLLANHVAADFHTQSSIDITADKPTMENLLRQVEDGKHTLSVRDHAMFRIDHQGVTAEIKVTRDQFQEMSRGLLERTSFTTRQVLMAAGLDWPEISRILLVGGSSRMPMVPTMLEKLSGISADRSINPDEAVARGAALFAAYQLSKQAGAEKTAFQITDVCAHSLGIQGIDQGSLHRENVIVIPRNTSLPARVMRPFVTQIPGQQSIIVQVLEGESNQPDLCSRIGRSVLRELPDDLPKGHPVHITFIYGTNARLAVEAFLPERGHRVTIELERESGLNTAELGRWRQLVQQDGTDVADLLTEALQVTVNAVSDQTPESTTGKQTDHPASGQAVASGATSAAPGRQRLVSEEEVALKEDLSSRPIETATPLLAIAEGSGQPNPAGGSAGFDLAKKFNPDRQRKRIQRAVFVMGHVVSATIGLALGYYILCKLRPEADVLNLFSP